MNRDGGRLLPLIENSGFTLLESLVAVLIIAVGLLGLSGLQWFSLRSVNQGLLRSQATALANDMAERVRANPRAVVDGNFTDLASTVFCSNFTGPYCSASSCSTQELARYDFSAVACGTNAYSGAQNLLPEGQLALGCTIDAADAICRITVSWTELARPADDSSSDANNGTVNRQVDLTIQPLRL